MSLPGKVIEVNNDEVIVEVSPKPECQGCHACKGLLGDEKISSLKKISALKGNLNPKVGDQVILDTNPGEGTIAAVAVFGFPMGSFIIGLFSAPYFAQFLNQQVTDGFRLIIGVVLMALSFVLLSIFSNTATANKLCLKVVEITNN